MAVPIVLGECRCKKWWSDFDRWCCRWPVACQLANARPPARTTLANPSQSYRVAKTDYVVLNRGEVEAVIVNNAAVDDGKLPGHQVGTGYRLAQTWWGK